MKKYISLLLSLSLVNSQVLAECAARTPKFMELEVVACDSVDSLVLQEIDGEDYLENEIEALRRDFDTTSIVTVIPRSNVDIIDWNDNGVLRRYRSNTETISDSLSMIVSMRMGVDFCEQFYLGKTSLFALDEKFQCCRDAIVSLNGRVRKETTAICLLDLGMIVRYNESASELPEMEINIPNHEI